MGKDGLTAARDEDTSRKVGIRSDQLLSQSTMKQNKLTEELGHLRWQGAAKNTFSEDLKLIAEGRKRPAKRANVVGRCENALRTMSTAANLALFTKRSEFKNCCEDLTLNN